MTFNRFLRTLGITGVLLSLAGTSAVAAQCGPELSKVQQVVLAAQIASSPHNTPGMRDFRTVQINIQRVDAFGLQTELERIGAASQYASIHHFLLEAGGLHRRAEKNGAGLAHRHAVSTGFHRDATAMSALIDQTCDAAAQEQNTRKAPPALPSDDIGNRSATLQNQPPPIRSSSSLGTLAAAVGTLVGIVVTLFALRTLYTLTISTIIMRRTCAIPARIDIGHEEFGGEIKSISRAGSNFVAQVSDAAAAMGLLEKGSKVQLQAGRFVVPAIITYPAETPSQGFGLRFPAVLDNKKLTSLLALSKTKPRLKIKKRP